MEEESPVLTTGVSIQVGLPTLDTVQRAAETLAAAAFLTEPVAVGANWLSLATTIPSVRDRAEAINVAITRLATLAGATLIDNAPIKEEKPSNSTLTTSRRQRGRLRTCIRD